MVLFALGFELRVILCCCDDRDHCDVRDQDYSCNFGKQTAQRCSFVVLDILQHLEKGGTSSISQHTVHARIAPQMS